MKSNKIVFTNCTNYTEIDKPQPASSFLPSWYKELDSYMGKIKKPAGNGQTLATVKRCMPVFDALTSGYIIVTPADVYVSQIDGSSHFEWSALGMIGFHPVEQAPTHPANNVKTHYPKWINPWAVRTPKGYSSLFVQPFHRDSFFTILPGIVDTDKYFAPVNFPFVLNDANFEGLIPAGTPVAQVIPFKRESWNLEIGGYEEIKEIQKVQQQTETRLFDKYKLLFRTKKEYK